MPDELIRLVQI